MVYVHHLWFNTRSSSSPVVSMKFSNATSVVNSADLQQLQALFDAAYLTRINTYSQTAAIAVLAYDILLNFCREVTYIWSSRWTLPKLLYLVIRYYGILELCVIQACAPLPVRIQAQCLTTSTVQVTVGLTLAEYVVPYCTQPMLTVPRRCQAWGWLYNLAGLVVFTTTVNVILVLRIHALYERSKKVLIFMITITSCQFVLELAVSVWDGIDLKLNPPPPIVPWQGCVATALRSATLISWIPNILISAICAGMTLYRFFKGPDGERWRRDRRTSPLLATFMRDGTTFFVAVFVVELVASMLTVNLVSPLTPFMIPWVTVTYSIGASHMILNLRVSARLHTVQHTFTTMETTVTEPVFEWASTPRYAENENLEYDSFQLSTLGCSSNDMRGRVVVPGRAGG
ncbi:hypothetical protein C8Q73DRAFT_354684 [Cubamyces lactineus]|nr:hypothetical protein C8Q73DRAFT_354684 [Cubamyces lactineus]